MGGDVVGFLFENEHLIRTLEREADPWFVAPDVCKALELRNVTDAVGRLDDDEKGLGDIETLGGLQRLNIVSEPGLYRLVSRSNKPVAKRFDRWVRHTVLPTIRKTGRFGPAGASSSAPGQSQPVLPRPFDEWTVAEMNARVGAVAEYRMSIGPQAGQWAMQRLGFAMPPAQLLPSRQYELDLRPNPPR